MTDTDLLARIAQGVTQHLGIVPTLDNSGAYEFAAGVGDADEEDPHSSYVHVRLYLEDVEVRIQITRGAKAPTSASASFSNCSASLIVAAIIDALL